MPKEYRVLNITSGPVELHDYRKVLGPTEFTIIIGEPAEELRWYQGRRFVKVTEILQPSPSTHDAGQADAPAHRRRAKQQPTQGGI